MIELKPKEAFVKTEYAKKHAELVTNSDFLNSLSVAITEMELNLPKTGNPSVAWDCHCQMVGVRNFIDVFLNLAEPPKPSPKPINKNLKPE